MQLLFLVLWAARADPALDEAWYQWRTDRTDAAMALAQAKLDTTPDDLAWLHLRITAGVHDGDGARLEDRYREAFADNPANLAWRVALAQVLAARNTTPGRWCDEIERLTSAISPTDEPEIAYYALKASILSHRACPGSPETDGANVRRAAQDTPLAAADAAIDRIESHYVHSDLPQALDAALVADPLRLRDVEAAWDSAQGGNDVAALRRVVHKALRRQSTSERPAEVWAAVEGWRESGNHRRKDEAAAHLRSLDAEVDPMADRSPLEVSDPEVYGDLDALSGLPATTALDRLDDMAISDAAVAVQARAATLRAALHEKRGATEAAHTAHRRAWELTRDNRLYALRFARSAAATGADAALALEALAVLMADRTVNPLAEKPSPLEERRRKWTVRNLELRAQVHSHAGNTAAAVADRLELLRFDASPAHHAALGAALLQDAPLAANATDGAVLHLATALAAGVDDASATRSALEAAGGAMWHPRGLGALLVDAGVPVDGAFEDSPLAGARWPALEDDDAVDGPLELIATVASWSPHTTAFLASLVRAAAAHGDAVGVQASAVDVTEDAWTRWAATRTLPLEVSWKGPAALRELATIHVPSVALVAPDGTVIRVIRSWNEDDTRLEDALSEALEE